MMEEMGERPALRLQGDSSACKGTLQREGAGKIKHLEVRQLWMQEKIKSGRLIFEKIDRSRNVADTLTKHWSNGAYQLFHSASFYPMPAEDAEEIARPSRPAPHRIESQQHAHTALLRGGARDMPHVSRLYV